MLKIGGMKQVLIVGFGILMDLTSTHHVKFHVDPHDRRSDRPSAGREPPKWIQLWKARLRLDVVSDSRGLLVSHVGACVQVLVFCDTLAQWQR